MKIYIINRHSYTNGDLTNVVTMSFFKKRENAEASLVKYAELYISQKIEEGIDEEDIDMVTYLSRIDIKTYEENTIFQLSYRIKEVNTED